MQPLLQLLRWESAITAHLESALGIKREDAARLLEAYPALIRKSWQAQHSAEDTAKQLIILSSQEKIPHD